MATRADTGAPWQRDAPREKPDVEDNTLCDPYTVSPRRPNVQTAELGVAVG